MASGDYDEKIQQLFEEGKKLGAPGLLEVNIAKATGKGRKSKRNHNPLVEMSDLELELEMQNKETSRLQQEVDATRDRIHSTGHYAAAGPYEHKTFRVPSHNANTNNNNYRPVSAPLASHQTPHMFPTNEISVLTKTKIHLENALEDSQAQVEYLSQKLDDMKRSMDEQKEHFRNAVEELQGKLQETVAGRKKLNDVRQQEANQQEDMIHRLQTTLKELAASNQMQEQALLDAHERMEILENRSQSNERAMSQIRSILGSTSYRDAARNKRYAESADLAELLPELLVDNFERFITNTYEEADSLRNKVLQLEAELNAANQSHAAERLLTSSDSAEAMQTLKDRCEKTLAEEKAKRANAEEQLSVLTSETKELQIDNNTQSRLVADSRQQINELQKQLDELRQDHCKEKGDLQSKLVSIEYDVKLASDVKQHLTAENETLMKSASDAHTRLQQTIEDLQAEREQRKALWVKDADASREINEMRVQVEEKTAEISRLREIAAQLRGDLSTRVVREINEAENAQRVKADERIATITAENIALRENISRVQASLDAAERQKSDDAIERASAMKMIQEKDRQVDRLTSQLSLSDRKFIEATEAKKTLEEKLKTLQGDYSEVTKLAKKTTSELERARSVADDKERIAMQLRHQLETKTGQQETSSRHADDVVKEREALKVELTDQASTIGKLNEEVKSKEDALADYESRMADLVEEKGRIVNDIHGIEEQVTNLMTAKEEATNELQEARYQLGHLIEERDSLSKDYKSLQGRSKSESEKLKKELRQTKKDLHQAQDTLHTVQNIDGKAAKIAASMQKELTDKRAVIDSLQTELSKVYDKLEVEQRGHKHHRKESVRLEKQIDELKTNLKKSDVELRNKTKTEKGYKLGVERLQMALEKAAVRNAEAQVVIDRQDSELSRAHIKHNLDLMDKRIPSVPLGQVEERLPPIQPQNSFGRPPMVTNNNGVLQNMLARILATMATQAQSRDTTLTLPAKSVTASKPTEPEPPGNIATNEIYKVLTEVRDHLTSRDRSSIKSSSSDVISRRRKDKSKKSRHIKKMSASSANESSELPVVYIDSDVTSVRSDPGTTLSDDTLRLSHQSYEDFLLTSSPRKSAPVGFGAREERPPSPVSILLAGGDGIHHQAEVDSSSPTRILREKNRSPSRDVYEVTKKEDTRDKLVNAAISDNAEELCRQLQNRLDGLTKIGGKLERQNKVTANLMKKQDKKLQRVRLQGKKLR